MISPPLDICSDVRSRCRRTVVEIDADEITAISDGCFAIPVRRLTSSGDVDFLVGEDEDISFHGVADLILSLYPGIM